MGKDFTVVGEWKLISVSSYNYAGIVKSNNLYVYNNASTGLNIYVCSSTTSNYIHGVKSLKAIRFNGKFYTQDGVKYKCTRDSGTPLSHDLKDLVGTYVETV